MRQIVLNKGCKQKKKNLLPIFATKSSKIFSDKIFEVFSQKTSKNDLLPFKTR